MSASRNRAERSGETVVMRRERNAIIVLIILSIAVVIYQWDAVLVFVCDLIGGCWSGIL